MAFSQAQYNAGAAAAGRGEYCPKNAPQSFKDGHKGNNGKR
ncbi:MAG: hypothetical protein AAFR27_01600 [Pseudomonadota bacterium]